jgi:uncharacterized protein YaaW (UPF0174 family)
MEPDSIEAGSLLAVLRRASHPELEAIVVALSNAFDVLITSDRRYTTHQNDLTQIPEVIADHVCRAGGHAVVNWFRGGGPEYAEVVRDVCGALDVNPLPGSIVAMEEALLKVMLDRAIAQLGSVEREELLRKMREAAGRPVGFADVLRSGGPLMGVLAPYIFAAVGRQAAARGVVLVLEAVGARVASGVLGPIGIVLGTAWLAHDLAGPSLRATVPAAVEVARLRQRLLWADMP